MKILMGNEAMGRAIVEGGCTLAASYPGTPASEILEAVVACASETGAPIHAEWSVNEKVAYETALANSMSGLRSAVSMKQVGLNVASDPFMRSAYLGVRGGFVLVSADDPGPHSSQTEQDSRFFSMFAKVPVLDPSSPREAGRMVREALELSERYEIPVMVRPTTRVCHARQPVEVGPPQDLGRKADFRRDPRRWCATPQALRELHRELNGKIARISGERALAPALSNPAAAPRRRCLVASGVAFALAWDVLEAKGLLEAVDIFQVRMPYPLAKDFIININNSYEHILILEETYPVIELQLSSWKALGKRSGTVPGEGELLPEVLEPILTEFLGEASKGAVKEAPGGGARPTLCAGCGHRAAFYAIRKALPTGIFPSDIGCYTLGMNLRAVDSCHCMGAGISQAAGFYRAYAAGGDWPPIVATIGDSTFFHAGVPALVNAVIQKARFVLVILDNATTAMTGHQPTPEVGLTARGERTKPVLLADLVRASGVEYLKEADPYDIPAFIALVREADAHARSAEGGVAVIIARHPCLLDRRALGEQAAFDMCVTEDCTGCRLCLRDFECPALAWDEAVERVTIDKIRCVGCGNCVEVCPAGAVKASPRAAGGKGARR